MRRTQFPYKKIGGEFNGLANGVLNDSIEIGGFKRWTDVIFQAIAST